MSVKIIQERLDREQYASSQEEEFAVREIYQEVALAALSRTDFFKQAGFQGGTALRILYSLDRFSEDLDFLLKKPDPDFQMSRLLKTLTEEFSLYGIPISIQEKSKEGNAVQKLFLKQESSGMLLILRHKPQGGQRKLIRIKIEVDTNPPAGGSFETKYLDFPFPFAVTVQDLPSLFAGKSHALLCRAYTKGRDWYDFLWYVAREAPINFDFLSQACQQNGPWENQKISMNKQWFLSEMEKKIKSTDWNAAKNDVARFLSPHELVTLELWTPLFFLDRLEKVNTYLKE